MRRARYTVVEDQPGQPLVIRDLGPWDEHPTITNDAEGVVAELHLSGHLPADRRLFYHDSEGSLDEILLDAAGCFAGFAPGPRVRRCRVCGCTDEDCRQCIAKTGHPCHWVEVDLCSACVGQE